MDGVGGGGGGVGGAIVLQPKTNIPCLGYNTYSAMEVLPIKVPGNPE